MVSTGYSLWELLTILNCVQTQYIVTLVPGLGSTRNGFALYGGPSSIRISSALGIGTDKAIEAQQIEQDLWQNGPTTCQPSDD